MFCIMYDHNNTASNEDWTHDSNSFQDGFMTSYWKVLSPTKEEITIIYVIMN